MKKSPSSLGLCALIVLAVSSGCRAPVTCAEIVDSRPTTAPFGNVTSPATERWVIDSYGLRASEMRVYDLGDGKSEIQWHASDRAYEALVGAFNDGRLVIRVSWESQNPVLSEILQCYGPPAAYQAGYEPAPVAGTSLYLYYPQTGLVIGGRRNTTNRSIGNGFEMSTATFIAPAKSAVDMLPAIHSPPGEWPRFSEAASLRPWPDDLRDIVLDVHPAYQ